MNNRLQQCMVDEGWLTAEQLEEARKAAKGDAVDEVVAERGWVTLHQLGRLWSAFYQLPYVTLLTNAPSKDARIVLSPACCNHWGVFPVSYNSSRYLLTLAVSRLEDAVRIERIQEFFMQPYSVAFTVASGMEIAAAQKKFLHA